MKKILLPIVFFLLAAPVQAQFVVDTFTDTANDILQSAHTGETGATWAVQSGATGTAIISNANRAYCTTIAARCAYYASGTPVSADYEVQATIRQVTNNTTSYMGVSGRMATGAATRYTCVYDWANTRWDLQKAVTGTITSLGTFGQSTANATDYVVKLTMSGTAISCAIDGTTRISATDSGITAAGKAGFDAFDVATDTAGYHIDTFSATDITASTGHSLSLLGVGR